MKEEMKLFIQKLVTDEELQRKMLACKSPEEAYALASSVQEGFTFDEFVETMTELNDMEDQELTREDMAKVAGGVSIGDMLISGSAIVTVIGSAFGAAAA